MVGRLTIVAELVPQAVAKTTLPEFSQTVTAAAVVGAAALALTVTVSVVANGLAQAAGLPTQANVNVVTPVAVVEMLNAAKVVLLAELGTPPPTAAVVPSEPVAPLLTPVAVLAVPDDVPVANTQSVLTRSGAPWQMVTEPLPPGATARSAGVPPTAVIEALFGEGFTVTDRLATAELEQPDAFTQTIE